MGFTWIVLIVFLSRHVAALRRTVGPKDDYRFIAARKVCDGDNPAMFAFRKCSVLTACIFDHLDEAFKTSMASGTSIAALLPTILALIGSPPLELVQLALASPHRALATCCFTIGLPSGLFRQLRPVHRSLAMPNVQDPRKREWSIPMSSLSQKTLKNVLAKVAVDVVVFALVSIMLWQNWIINSFTMVPWRCEYSFLLFMWPIACMFWLLIAMFLLYLMAESYEFEDAHHQPLPTLTFKSLICLPYKPSGARDLSKYKASVTSLPSTQNGSHTVPVDTSTSTVDHATQAPVPLTVISPLPTSGPQRSDTSAFYAGYYVRARVIMPSSFGFRSWRVYEAIIETLAVGIYLYATFVLTSTMFLNADNAIVFATVMCICLSAIRILTTLF